jgi:hypothetical protein
VDFANSHAVFPSQTMPNAAAIATGHYPGDTGQFANQIFTAYPLFDKGHFGQARGTMVPDVEDPLVLGDINDHFGGNYLREASVVALARSYGYSTAVIGKVGPAASQDVSELNTVRGALRNPITIVLDGAMGTPRRALAGQHRCAAGRGGLAPAPPPRTSPPARTRRRARKQRTWCISNGSPTRRRKIRLAFAKAQSLMLVFCRAILIHPARAGRQPNSLTPGINYLISTAAIHNADRSLRHSRLSRRAS